MGRAGGGTGGLSVNTVQQQHRPKSADVCMWKGIWVLVNCVWGVGWGGGLRLCVFLHC